MQVMYITVAAMIFHPSGFQKDARICLKLQTLQLEQGVPRYTRVFEQERVLSPDYHLVKGKRHREQQMKHCKTTMLMS